MSFTNGKLTIIENNNENHSCSIDLWGELFRMPCLSIPLKQGKINEEDPSFSYRIYPFCNEFLSVKQNAN